MPTCGQLPVTAAMPCADSAAKMSRKRAPPWMIALRWPGRTVICGGSVRGWAVGTGMVKRGGCPCVTPLSRLTCAAVADTSRGLALSSRLTVPRLTVFASLSSPTSHLVHVRHVDHHALARREAGRVVPARARADGQPVGARERDGGLNVRLGHGLHDEQRPPRAQPVVVRVDRLGQVARAVKLRLAAQRDGAVERLYQREHVGLARAQLGVQRATAGAVARLLLLLLLLQTRGGGRLGGGGGSGASPRRSGAGGREHAGENAATAGRRGSSVDSLPARLAKSPVGQHQDGRHGHENANTGPRGRGWRHRRKIRCSQQAKGRHGESPG